MKKEEHKEAKGTTSCAGERKIRYAFVIDAEGKKLDPTHENNAWKLVRTKRARLLSRTPMKIQLNHVVENPNTDEIHLGIDDGGKHVGIALVQKCRTRNKVIFLATMEHRRDVKHLMDVRRGYRRYRRYHKKFRTARFNNRRSARRGGRVAPSILQKKQATVRLAKTLLQSIRIDQIHLEDVAIDVRALVDGEKLAGTAYQKSNRLDGNLRKAILLRDGCRCQMCGAGGRAGNVLEVHHIKPKRDGGTNTQGNLVTLCSECHKKVTGQEEKFAKKLYGKIQSKGDILELKPAMHVMIGKKWLRQELGKLCKLSLTSGGDTANTRLEWGIEKSHANDAVCITGLKTESGCRNIYALEVLPLRKKRKTTGIIEVCGFRHRDIVSYTYKNGETHTGYVTALYPALSALNFTSPSKECKKVNARKCRFVDRPRKFIWRFSG